MALKPTQLLSHDRAFAHVLENIGPGADIGVGNAVGSAVALLAAALAEGERSILLVAPSTRRADALAGDISLFTEIPVRRYPRLEPGGEALPDFSAFKDRADIVFSLRNNPDRARIIVAEADALMQHLPDYEKLSESRIELEAGGEFPLEKLQELLAGRGYDRVHRVEFPCEYAVRGGILDLYAPTDEQPVRIEFEGDRVDSLRRFSTETQTTTGEIERVALSTPSRDEVARARPGDDSVTLAGCLGEGSVVIYAGADAVEKRLADSGQGALLSLLAGDIGRFAKLGCESLPVAEGGVNLDAAPAERVGGGPSRVVEEMRRILEDGDARINLFVLRDAERERLTEIFRAGKLDVSRIEMPPGVLSSGFAVGRPREYMLSTDELFDRYRMRRQLRPSRYRRAIESFLELKPGDYVVHTSHGIGRFHGLTRMARRGREEDYLIVEYADRQLLYVPATNIGLVQKYIGGREVSPRLAKVGGTLWQRQKAKVQEALFDLATELLEIQAMREARKGIEFPPDTLWQHEFEAAFPYDDTPDQEFAAADIKRDMESRRPADRLLCGDVGYGKTEIAMRAAFKAVSAEKQVAILVPTTILAQQHYTTFTERMAEFPIIVDVLSRFRSAKEQKEIVERAREGKIDILIGTHRLLSEDVRFKDLGLLVIDEEQRFGVTHKERLKKMRAEVDILTLTATPIPRTLHMSLLGIKDISTLETPPLDRRAIVTEIHRWSADLIRNGIMRELERGGQVYFVHNRVYNIEHVRRALEKICPEARYAVCHGQMEESLLEERMLEFVRGKHDVLISTTIIESGLDIPNVNTIFMNRAEMFGLADLHQLRGRVGRYRHQAYAYLLLPEAGMIPEAAEKRLRAIEEFNELGAGFKIAMRDLEIRGSGNILGKEQSGHIAVVGYDLYCKLLENSVRQVKDEAAAEDVNCDVDVHPEGYIEKEYAGADETKIEIYRRATSCREEEALDALVAEVRDRFGEPPQTAVRFFEKHRLRIRAESGKIFYLGIQGKTVIVKFRELAPVEAAFGRFARRLRLIGPDTAYFDLAEQPESPEEALSVLLDLLQKIPSAAKSARAETTESRNAFSKSAE
ncbi:MAG: transcription-repair coupling factor [Planctomycetota bacterium]|jgi:transcription-repair coupling factor (superfamily II helicase)